MPPGSVVARIHPAAFGGKIGLRNIGAMISVRL
jgi:hypothetical protein